MVEWRQKLNIQSIVQPLKKQAPNLTFYRISEIILKLWTFVYHFKHLTIYFSTSEFLKRLETTMFKEEKKSKRFLRKFLKKDPGIIAELSENKYHNQLLMFAMTVVKKEQAYLHHLFSILRGRH